MYNSRLGGEIPKNQHKGANMMRLDDNDEDELYRMLEKRRNLQEIGSSRRWGICGSGKTKYPNHTFHRKTVLDTDHKYGFYGDGHSIMVGIGVRKKLEVMTSQEVMTNQDVMISQTVMTSQEVMTSHVYADKTTTCRYPPVRGKRELVHFTSTPLSA